jgi:hypothetical protein
MAEKQPTSFRLTDKAQALLAKIAEEAGTSQSAVVETLIRDKAKAEHIEFEEPKA